MMSMTREEAEHAYDVQLTRLVNGLHALADALERAGNCHRGHPSGYGREAHVDRVWAASEVHRRLLGWLGQHNGDLMLLWYAAVKAEHAGARSTPAEMLDRAATAVGDAGMLAGPDGAEVLVAEAALRGAGVLR